MRLKDRVAIITGAASGIGAATAARFAEEGARVVIADINDAGGEAVAAAIRDRGGQAVFVHADVSQDADLERMINIAVETFGTLHILHNNAYWTLAQTALETTPENWQRTLDITLRPVWLATKLAVPHLRQSGKGVVINTSSVQGVVGLPGYLPYQAAKGGVVALTRALALELAPEIRVVSIAPGPINTPAVNISAAEENSLDALIARVPLGRLGEPVEIANTAVFLASDEASYITGTTIMVDGGFTAH